MYGNDRIEILLAEFDTARRHTDALWVDLPDKELRWRPHEDSSAIGWHLGHQAAVCHFMTRNLVAAEPSLSPRLDSLMDSATAERERGDLPSIREIERYRAAAAASVHARAHDVLLGRVGAPNQLGLIVSTLLTALVNHEYQHDQWIAEVRHDALGRGLPEPPASEWLVRLDGYLTVRADL